MKYTIPFFFVLAGCMVGPKYEPPKMSLAQEFDEGKGKVEQEIDLACWWKQFNDPVLDSLIEEALSSNYDLHLALEKIEQTRAQYRIERSYLWPEIDVHATAVRTRVSQNLLPIESEVKGGLFPKFLNVFQVGFDAIWELDFFGKLRREKNAAKYIWEATKEDAENVLISMLSEVAINYVNIRALQKRIDLVKKKIAADDEKLSIKKALFQIGLSNEMEVMTQISSLESDRATLPVLETSFKQTVYALAYLLGRSPEGFLEIFQEVKGIPSGSGRVPAGLPSDLLRRRPDVRSAERQLAAATEQVGAAVADFFPHFALTGISLGAGDKVGSSFGFEGDKVKNLLKSASQMFSFGLGMNWDFLDFGRVRSQVDMKKSLQRQALLTYEQTVIASLKDVESALVAYFEEEVRRSFLKGKVAADLRTYEIMQNLQQVGLASEMQVLEAKKILIDSESFLAEGDQALTGDLIAIYKAIGGNWLTQ